MLVGGKPVRAQHNKRSAAAGPLLAIACLAARKVTCPLPSLLPLAGTPAEVSNVLLENKAGVADTIIVKYTPPAVDIAQESTAGNYR